MDIKFPSYIIFQYLSFIFFTSGLIETNLTWISISPFSFRNGNETVGGNHVSLNGNGDMMRENNLQKSLQKYADLIGYLSLDWI